MATNPLSVKDRIRQIVDDQPEDSSYSEIIREIAFARMVERGLADVDAGRGIDDEEMAKKIDAL